MPYNTNDRVVDCQYNWNKIREYLAKKNEIHDNCVDHYVNNACGTTYKSKIFIDFNNRNILDKQYILTLIKKKLCDIKNYANDLDIDALLTYNMKIQNDSLAPAHNLSIGGATTLDFHYISQNGYIGYKNFASVDMIKIVKENDDYVNVYVNIHIGDSIYILNQKNKQNIVDHLDKNIKIIDFAYDTLDIYKNIIS